MTAAGVVTVLTGADGIDAGAGVAAKAAGTSATDAGGTDAPLGHSCQTTSPATSTAAPSPQRMAVRRWRAARRARLRERRVLWWGVAASAAGSAGASGVPSGTSGRAQPRQYRALSRFSVPHAMQTVAMPQGLLNRQPAF